MKKECIISALILFLAYSNDSSAQTYDIYIANRQLTAPKIFEFDVFVRSNGNTTSWPFKLYQSAYKFAASFVNGGILSGSYISGSSELESSFGKTWGFSFNTTQKILNQSSNIGSICPGAVIGTVAKKIGRFRVTNTVNYGCTDDSISFVITPFGTLYLAIGKYNSLDCSDLSSSFATAGANYFVENPGGSLLVSQARLISSVKPCENAASISVSAYGGLSPYAGTGIFQMGRGNWFFPVSDARGCLTSASITVESIPFYSSFSDSGCGSYLLPWGSVIIESGSYSHTYVSAGGCDSIVTANIFLGQPNSGIEQISLRNDQFPYVWNGLSINTAGVYSTSLKNNSGCDSVVTLDLKLIDTCSPRGISSNAVNDSICAGSSVTLTVQGNLSSGAVWKWYRGGCGAGSAIGSGSSFRISPDITRTYYVRQQGGACGTSSCASITIYVNSKPATPASILGNISGLCNLSGDFSIAPVLNANNYLWSVPDNLIVQTGQGSNKITVPFGNNLSAGNSICVKAVNDCGASTQRCVSVSLRPSVSGGISGPSTMTIGQQSSFSGTAYGASGYLWNVPAGWSIVNGQGTGNVSLIAGTTNGYIRLTPSNACGYGPMTNKLVTLLASAAKGGTDNEDIRMGPVPVRDVLMVEAKEPRPHHFSLVDDYGRILLQSSFTNQIDLRTIPDGHYFLIFYCQKNIIRKSIQILH